MKAIWVLMLVFGFCASGEAQAKRCDWLKRREFVRYQFEKIARARFSKEVNRKLQEFLDALTEVERADIRVYGTADSDRGETLLELRRRLSRVVADFNISRCKKGTPKYEDGYPSKDTCVDSDGSIEYMRPDFYRGLRLTADANGIYIEGEIRQDSRRRLIRSRGDFYAGDYVVHLTLGTAEEEKKQIASTAAEFNFIDFDDYLNSGDRMPADCK